MWSFFRRGRRRSDANVDSRCRKRKVKKQRRKRKRGGGDAVIIPTFILDPSPLTEADVTVTSLPRFLHTMEGDFVVGYLSNTVLSKGTASGLGTIQKPLRDAYFEYKKTSGKKGKKKDLSEVGLRVTPQGVYILLAGSHPGSNESFYDMSSISFFEAVTFKTVKGTDKKIQAGFLPIEISRSPSTGSEKLFTPLDKKYQNFAKMDHPAIIALVMRRTTGVRALEFHSFICETEQQALAIVNLIGMLQERGQDPRSMEYQRQSSGPYDPYAGQPRRPDLVQGDFRDPGPGYERGGPGQADYLRTSQRPPDGWEGGGPVRYGGAEPRGFLDPQRDDRFIPPRGYGDDERRMKGDGRYYEEEVRFRHDRQRSGDFGPDDDFMNRRSGDFRLERQRSNEFGRDSDIREGRVPEEEVRYRHERQRSNEIRRPEEFGDRRSVEYRHVRQVSGEIQGDRRSAGITHERQGSGDITPRDDLRSSRDMRDYGRQGRPESRPDNQFRIPRPVSPGRHGPATAPKPPRALSPGPYRGDGDYQQRPPLRSPRDERGPPPHSQLRASREERGPPPQGPEYSLSSLESRQEMESQPNKPVARVPPHLVSGVKVLPTGFRASIQQKSAQKLPRSPMEERRNIIPDDEQEDPYDNAISRREFYSREARNVKSQGDERYFDVPGKDTRYTYHPPPDVLPPEERDRHREKLGDFDDYDQVIRRDDNFNDQKGRNANYRYSAPPAEHKPWSYEEQLQKFSKERDDDDPRHSASDFRFYDGSGGRKPYDVQDKFDKMNIRNQNTGPETNFEESLGYFP